MANRIVTIAHRGASGYELENTIEAFKKAIDLGADFIELDVQKSSDDQVIVYHDTKFEDGSVVAEMSSDQAKRKALKKGIKVPVLDEVLKVVNNKIGLNIEIKSAGMIDLLIEKLKGYNTDGIILSSFMHNCLLELKQKAPHISLGALVSIRPMDPLEILHSTKTDLIIQNFEFIDKSYVELLHKNDKKIFVWTVNYIGDIKRAIDFDVDGIITDYPDRVKGVLSNLK